MFSIFYSRMKILKENTLPLVRNSPLNKSIKCLKISTDSGIRCAKVLQESARCPRRNNDFSINPSSLFIFFLIATFGGIALVILSESQPDLVPIMVAFAKGGVQATLEICYLANSFLFPAIFSGTAFGICNAGAKISTIVSPILAEFNPPLPMIIFSIFTSMGSFLSIFLRT
jgi:hypothetical protein